MTPGWRRGAVLGLHGLALVALAALVACDTGAEDPLRAPDAAAVRLDTLASDLEVPWAIDVAPDGRIFVTERPGRIRVVEDDRLREEPWAEIDVVPPSFRSEGGLLGIAVSPDFEETGHVFVAATVRTEDGLANRVIRLTDRDGRGQDPEVIVDGLPGPRTEPGSERAIHTHVGGALTFGPDGALYVTTGDATYPEAAQDTSSLAGKVLRYAPDGTIPGDNPIPGSAVYALGLRNPQGLARLGDGDLLASEHGPSELSWEPYSGWFGDELNVVRAGRNYGWPEVAGTGSEDERFADPLREWSPSIAPAGVAVARTEGASPEVLGLVASLRNQHIRVLGLERAADAPLGWEVVGERILLEGTVGRIRAVTLGPDGHLYFSSSNRDDRGQPSAGDDHVFRLRR